MKAHRPSRAIDGARGGGNERALVYGIWVPVLRSQKDVGRSLGITGARVGQIEREAIAKIADYFKCRHR